MHTLYAMLIKKVESKIANIQETIVKRVFYINFDRMKIASLIYQKLFNLISDPLEILQKMAESISPPRPLPSHSRNNSGKVVHVTYQCYFYSRFTYGTLLA